MKIHKLLAAMLIGASTLFGFGVQSQAAIVTDIVMMVDESGSMSNVQANLRNNIGAFASILSAGGIDARYALVGYGNGSVIPRLLTDFTTPAGFATAAGNLVASGGTEPGYTAIDRALNGVLPLTYRAGALKNLIIFTDEPSNGDSSYGSSFTTADDNLTFYNALFNAVLRGTSTEASYSPLASGHGGNVYDLNDLNTTDQTVVSAFVDSFARSKLQEIVDYCTLHPNDPACQGGSVPEPGTLALIGLAIVGLRLTRRSAAAK